MMDTRPNGIAQLADVEVRVVDAEGVQRAHVVPAHLF